MRHRGWPLLAALAALLVLAVVAGTLTARQHAERDIAPAEETTTPEEALLDAVMDRIGVTRWSEALGWYEMQEDGTLPDGEATGDTPVWVARGGHGLFHSVPICNNIKSPVRMTLAEAFAEGRQPCPVCWDVADANAHAENEDP